MQEDISELLGGAFGIVVGAFAVLGATSIIPGGSETTPELPFFAELIFTLGVIVFVVVCMFVVFITGSAFAALATEVCGDES